MNNNATVIISIEDFDKLRSQAKAREALQKYLSSCLEIDSTDYQKEIQHLNDKSKNMTDEEYDKELDNLSSFITFKINKPLLQRVLFDSYKPKNVQEEMILDEVLFYRDNVKIEYVEEEI